MPLRNLLALAAALAAAGAWAQEVPPQPPPPSVTGPEQPAPADAPAPSAPPARPGESTAAAAQPSATSAPTPASEALPAFLRHLAATGAAWGPAPSPDGTRLGFVTTLFGSPQAALIPIASGYPVQVTDEPGGVLALRWAPTDPHLIFATVLRAGQRRVLLLDDAGGAPAELDRAPGEQLLGGFTRDGKRLLFAVLDEGKVALKWLTLEGRAVHEIAPPLPQAGVAPTPAGSKPLAPPAPLSESLVGLTTLAAPSPDGHFALAAVRRNGDENLVRVDLTSTRADALTPHQGAARFRFPRFSPDGRLIYCLTDAGRNALGVDAITPETKQRKTLFAPQTEVEAYALTEDGHRLVAAQVSGGETLFTSLELPSLRQQPLPQPPPGALQPAAVGEWPMAWSRASDRLYFGWGRSDDTVDVYVLRTDFGSATRLTHSPRPGIPDDALPRPKFTTYPSFDGRQIPALVWAARPLKKEPVASGAPRAAVLVNGGQARPLFDPRIAALGAAGVAVVAPGVRGSEGRGKEHAAEDAAGAVQDVAFAARWLKQSPDLDGTAPVLVGVGPGIEQAVAAAQREPGAWSGLVLFGERPASAQGLKIPVLAITAHGAAALGELVSFAREHLSRTSASAAR